MQTQAAVVRRPGDAWTIEEITLDPPKKGEVLVRMVGSGLCHSDEHLLTGDLPFGLPIIGGHEGAGVVEQVGEGVDWLAEGDHVVFGFVPACGRARRARPATRTCATSACTRPTAGRSPTTRPVTTRPTGPTWG